MNSIVCPVSVEKVYENVPRVIGALVVVILLMYVISGWVVLPAFLVVDFYLRGFSKGRYSLLANLAIKINTALPSQGKLINKAPKLFAARLGLVFSIVVTVLNLSGFPITSYYLSFILVVFASLESLANFCVGCIVFTLFVKPYAG